jgi:hypothetical protein
MWLELRVLQHFEGICRDENLQSTLERKNEIHILSPKPFVHSLIVCRDNQRNTILWLVIYPNLPSFLNMIVLYCKCFHKEALLPSTLMVCFKSTHLFYVTYKQPPEITYLKGKSTCISRMTARELLYCRNIYPYVNFPRINWMFQFYLFIGYTCLCCVYVTWPFST